MPSTKTFGWCATWKDPGTGLPTGVTHHGFATFDEAAEDARLHAPPCAEVVVVDDCGTPIEIGRQALQANGHADLEKQLYELS